MARQSVQEAVRNEMMHMRASALPKVSVAEQREIMKKYKKPSRHTVRSTHAYF